MAPRVSSLSSSLMGSLAKGFLRKVCGNSAENLRKFVKKCVLLRQERVRKLCGKFAEISRKFAENFLQWPLPERPHKLIADSLKICRFWVCVFPILPWRKYNSQRPLFGGDFVGQILAADSLPGAFVHSWTLIRAVLKNFLWGPKAH